MKPGLNLGVPEVEYHSDPAFSQSQAKVLLDSPARYRWQLDNPPPPRDVFDFGHAVHALVLGVGLDFDVLDFDDWRTKAARDARDESRTNGRVPMLAKDYDAAKRMAEATLANAGARLILEADGAVEVSFAWDVDGIACRGRADKLAATQDGLVIVDLKTTQDASPRGFTSSAAKFGYRLQGGAYVDGIDATAGETPPVVFIAVEKEPPHLVALYTLTDFDVEAGRAKWHEAVDLLAKCRADDDWPGYSPDIQTLYLPAWAL